MGMDLITINRDGCQTDSGSLSTRPAYVALFGDDPAGDRNADQMGDAQPANDRNWRKTDSRGDGEARDLSGFRGAKDGFAVGTAETGEL